MLPLPAPQCITSAGKPLELERLCCLPQKKKNLIFFQCTVFQQLCLPWLGPKRDWPDEARRWG